MVNVLVPIVDKKYDFSEILKKIGMMSEVNVFVGVNEDIYNDVVTQIGQGDNINYFKFANQTSRESIINYLQRFIGKGGTMIMRKPISLDEFNKFLLNGKDVVTCKRELTSTKSYIFKLWQKILKFFLGLNQYKGDPSVIYFGEDLSSVVSASGNLSFSSRANRWRGVEQGTVKVSGPTVRAEVDKKDIVRLLLIMVISLVVAVTVTTLVSVLTKVSIITGLLLVCLDIICLAIIAISIIIILFNYSVGKKVFKEAILLESNFAKDDYIQEYEDDEEDL